MKKNVWMFGIIAGIISVAWPVISIGVSTSGGAKEEIDWDMGMIYGYASMILAFSLIFVAIKRYRDNYNDGIISFGKAFKIGLFITLIASTVYVVIWLIDFFYFVPDFTEQYTSHLLEKLKESGASQAEIDKQIKEMAEFSQMYRNPFFNALITYTEIIPVGLVISLIASLILKKNSNTNTQNVSA